MKKIVLGICVVLLGLSSCQNNQKTEIDSEAFIRLNVLKKYGIYN